jgi:hypothetical protein
MVVGRFLLQTVKHYWRQPTTSRPIQPAQASVPNPGISSPLYLLNRRRAGDV